MTNFIKISLVSLALVAGAGAVHAESHSDTFDAETYFEQLERDGA